MAMKLPGFHRIVMQMYGLMSWFEYDSPPKAQVLRAWSTVLLWGLEPGWKK